MGRYLVCYQLSDRRKPGKMWWLKWIIGGETKTLHKMIMNIDGLLDIEHPSQIDNIELQILTTLHPTANRAEITGILLLNTKENVINTTREEGIELQQP